MKIRAISILCPKCGAGVRFCEEDRVIRCRHCGMNFLPIHSEGIERYYFEPKTKNPQAKAKTFLKEKDYTKADYRIVDIDNFFIPVWRGYGQVTGWLAGLSPRKTVFYTETITTANANQITVRRKRVEGGIPLKKLMRIDKEILLNAVRFPDIRWRNEEVKKDEYIPFLRVYNESKMMGWGKILTADVSPQLEKKEIKKRFIKSSLSFYSDYEPLRHRLKVIGQRIFLYYFPVSLIKVRLENQLVSLTVNGLSGKVTSNAILKEKPIQKNKRFLFTDIMITFLASFLSASLMLTNSLIGRQVAIVIIVITLLYTWIKR